jgi:hypothetical protein
MKDLNDSNEKIEELKKKSIQKDNEFKEMQKKLPKT